MALVYRQLSTHPPRAAYQAAASRLSAGAAKAAGRHLKRLFLALLDGDGEDRFARHPPGSVFDARYKSLTAQATYIDAAICRRARTR
jgi:hypothetical protein